MEHTKDVFDRGIDDLISPQIFIIPNDRSICFNFTADPADRS